LAESLLELFHSSVGYKIIGTRHGEKVYETLVTREEMARSEDMGEYFRIACDGRDLNYDMVESGNMLIHQQEEYHSHNTRRLDKEEMKGLLLKVDYVREQLDEFEIQH
jgi:UDP-glucose 4-epimerase